MFIYKNILFDEWSLQEGESSTVYQILLSPLLGPLHLTAPWLIITTCYYFSVFQGHKIHVRCQQWEWNVTIGKEFPNEHN